MEELRVKNSGSLVARFIAVDSIAIVVSVWIFGNLTDSQRTMMVAISVGGLTWFAWRLYRLLLSVVFGFGITVNYAIRRRVIPWQDVVSLTLNSRKEKCPPPEPGTSIHASIQSVALRLKDGTKVSFNCKPQQISQITSFVEQHARLDPYLEAKFASTEQIRGDADRHKNRRAIGLSITLAAACVISPWTKIYHAETASLAWPNVAGRVTDSKDNYLYPLKPLFPYRYKYVVRYEYQVGNKHYFGDRYNFLPPSASDHASVLELVNKHPVGSYIMVSFNPNNRADAVLYAGLSTETIAWVIGSSTALVLGAWYCVANTLRLRKLRHALKAAAQSRTLDH